MHRRASGLAGRVGAVLRRARARAPRGLRAPLADRADGPRGGGPAARRWAARSTCAPAPARSPSCSPAAGPRPGSWPPRSTHVAAACARANGVEVFEGDLAAPLPRRCTRRGRRGHRGRALRADRRAAAAPPRRAGPRAPPGPRRRRRRHRPAGAGPQPTPPSCYAPAVRCCSSWAATRPTCSSRPSSPSATSTIDRWSTTTVISAPIAARRGPTSRSLTRSPRHATRTSQRTGRAGEWSDGQRAAARAAAESSATSRDPAGARRARRAAR